MTNAWFPDGYGDGTGVSKGHVDLVERLEEWHGRAEGDIEDLQTRAAGLEADQGRVKVVGSDSESGYLADKLAEGENVTIETVDVGGGVRKARISSSGGGGGGGGATQGSVLGTAQEPFAVVAGQELVVETEEGESGRVVVDGFPAEAMSGDFGTSPMVWAGTGVEPFDLTGIGGIVPAELVSGLVSEPVDLASWIGVQNPYVGDNAMSFDTWQGQFRWKPDPLSEPVSLAAATFAEIAAWFATGTMDANDEIWVAPATYGFSAVVDAGQIKFRMTGTAGAYFGFMVMGPISWGQALALDKGQHYVSSSPALRWHSDGASGGIVPAYQLPDPGAALAEDVAQWLNDANGRDLGWGAWMFSSDGSGGVVARLEPTGGPGPESDNVVVEALYAAPVIGFDQAPRNFASGMSFAADSQYRLTVGVGTETGTVPAGVYDQDGLVAVLSGLFALAAFSREGGSVYSRTHGFGFDVSLRWDLLSGPGPAGGLFPDAEAGAVYGHGTVPDSEAGVSALHFAKLIDGGVIYNSGGATPVFNRRVHGALACVEGGYLRVVRELAGSAKSIRVTGALAAALGLDSNVHWGSGSGIGDGRGVLELADPAGELTAEHVDSSAVILVENATIGTVVSVPAPTHAAAAKGWQTRVVNLGASTQPLAVEWAPIGHVDVPPGYCFDLAWDGAAWARPV